jgi:hypothetical protein
VGGDGVVQVLRPCGKSGVRAGDVVGVHIAVLLR